MPHEYKAEPLCHYPLGIIFTDKFTISGILLSILSGLIHVFYFYFLGTAYKKADLSFVYPIARGTAVALVPIMGMLLIKESVSIIALIGVVVVFFGIFTLGNITQMKSVNSSDLFLSLITGITSLFGLSNLYLLDLSTDYFADSTLLNAFTHTWSLDVEEQFYIIFPLIVWFTGFGRKSINSNRNLLITIIILITLSLIKSIILNEIY